MYLYTVYIAFNPKYEKAISIFITTMSIVIAISILTVEELYLFTLVIALIVGFYVAISSDKRYENIKDKIDRFF